MLSISRERRLSLEGVCNFRDVGGYPAGDRHGSWGRLYHSSRLNELSDGDCSLRTGSPQWFDHVIDEVRVWKRARSGAEIAADFSRVLNVAGATDLSGYWRFEESATDVVLDATGEHRGQLGGGVNAANLARAETLAVPEPDSRLALAVALIIVAALSRRRGVSNPA